MSEFYLSSEAARELGCSAQYVRVLERTGKLKALKTHSGVRLFRIQEIRRLAAEREKGQRAARG
jgi:DNA-binding transcriptional MerR regulator